MKVNYNPISNRYTVMTNHHSFTGINAIKILFQLKEAVEADINLLTDLKDKRKMNITLPDDEKKEYRIVAGDEEGIFFSVNHSNPCKAMHTLLHEIQMELDECEMELKQINNKLKEFNRRGYDKQTLILACHMCDLNFESIDKGRSEVIDFIEECFTNKFNIKLYDFIRSVDNVLNMTPIPELRDNNDNTIYKL